MGNLSDVVNKAIADYGFRQVVLHSPEDIVRDWQLSELEAEILQGTLSDVLGALPVPVEPEDIPGQQERFALILHAEGLDL